jgi:16S rRNA (cytosine1402-N4)-methyltransferase
MRTRSIQSSSGSGSRTSKKEEAHISVLLQEAIGQLEIKPNDTVVDATLGGAGHAQSIVSKLGKDGTCIGFDLDHEAIVRAEKALVDVIPHVVLVESNFRHMQSELATRSITHIDKALFDLGWSSFQLTAGRGFSFLADEPLLMTYSNEYGKNTLTAAQIVNEWEEESIADVIFGWGEERYSRRIARAIVARRDTVPFTIASDLAEVIKSAVPSAYRHGKLHPATRTFQALRIATNDELGALRDGLIGAWHLLRSGGRIAVITFHSLEDRIVKEMFLGWEREGIATRVTRKAQKPSDEELSENPRARSAKLRVIEKN